MLSMKNIIEEALKERPIFHSEADFQHHLAWHIRLHNEGAKVRLEYPFEQDSSRKYCDIVVMKNGKPSIGIELKYKTKKLEAALKDGESFSLKEQGAHDVARYDFCKDIARLEEWCMNKKIAHGYAVFLTNDNKYWEESGTATIDAAFRIHDGSSKEGLIDWDCNKIQAKEKGKHWTAKKPCIKLEARYAIKWDALPDEEFAAKLKAAHKCTFKYTCVKVG